MGKNKNVSDHEVSHLLSHFEGARLDGGRLEEFSEVNLHFFFFVICFSFIFSSPFFYQGFK